MMDTADTERVLVVDFGGQYKELVARRVRECGVQAFIVPASVTPEELRAKAPIGLIFTGGPDSVYGENAVSCSPALLQLGIPVLGICYGMQLICHLLGGEVAPGESSEYGLTEAVLAESASGLFSALEGPRQVLMSHGDRVFRMPEGFTATAGTARCPIAAMECPARGLYAVQFHPETAGTEGGLTLLRNFLYRICGARGGYDMSGYLERQIAAVRARVGSRRVLLGLSGGVDSAVCAALLTKAIPGQLICIYVDHGLMRQGETEEISAFFSGQALDFRCVAAEERFLSALAGVTEPEEKRKIIGREFVRAFEAEARHCGDPAFLAQGTIYPDIVESGTASALIKSHHNVGGLPKELGFAGVVEPLAGLFKDEVRKLGTLLGLPPALVNRQPFPGPGLAIRCLGEVTPEKLRVLRAADAIVRAEFAASGARADQFFAVLTDARSVGVTGDGRSYGYVLAIRAVETSDFMTGEFARLPWELLARISGRITNEVPGAGRVVYDITGKPPATIEWE